MRRIPRLPALAALLLTTGTLLVMGCSSNPSDEGYSEGRMRGCALNRYEGCPDAPYAPQEPWPYTYYPLAAIPVYPIVPVYPAVPPVQPPPPPRKHHRRPPVGNHCEKPSPRKPSHGCP